MDVTINNQRLPASEAGGRYYRVFTPRSKSDKIRIHRDMSCLGTTVLSQIQLEQGTVPTAFVEPASEARNLSGLFKDLREIRLEMRDPNSEFWGKIVANNKGLLTEFANKEMKTAQAQTADSIMREVRSTLNGNYSSFEQRLNGTKAQIVTETTKSVTTNLSNLYDKQISDINGNLSRQSQTLTAFQRSLQDTNGNLSQVVQKIDGFQRDVTSVSGTASRALQTANQVSTSLTALDGRVSTAIRTVDGFRSEIASAKNDTNSRITQLSNLIDQRVTRSDVTSIIRQSGDNIMLAIQGKLPKAEGKMSGSEIKTALNLTTDGIRLKGDLIHLDGKALIDNAVIKSAMIDKITSANLSAAIIDAVHINANAVTADKIQSSRALINKLVATEGFFDTVFAKNLISTYIQAVDLSATQIKSGMLRSLNGAMYIDLNNAQTVFNQQATIKFNSTGNAFYRERKRYDNQSAHNTIGALLFKNSRHGGVMSVLGNTSHQTIDAMRNQLENGGANGDFAGIRIVRDDRDSLYDRIELVADRIIIGHSTNFNDSSNSGFYFLPVAVNGWWNLGKILQQISDKFRDHGWGALGNIYNMSHSKDVHPSQYT